MSFAFAPQDGRKLASVERVLAIRPIDNANAIEVATVRGWDVVVKKGDVSEGELVVYFEIDSFLPIENPAFEFLRASSLKTLTDGTQGYRLKTIRLRGQISQGLCLGVDALNIPSELRAEGSDVTELLNVRKYEVGIVGFGGVKRSTFPVDIVPKTSEERLQNIGNSTLKMHAERRTQFYITEKLDGTSFTAIMHNGRFIVCSRNQGLPEPTGAEVESIYWRVARQYNLREKLSEFGRGIAVQGEILAPKIQGNRYGVEEPALFLFSVYWTDTGAFASLDELKLTAERIGVPTVPILNDCLCLDAERDTVRSLVASADGLSTLHTTNRKTKGKPPRREGIVYRSVSSDGSRFGFKCISNAFLLKQKD